MHIFLHWYLFGGYFFTQNINGRDSITGYMRWDGTVWFHYWWRSYFSICTNALKVREPKWQTDADKSWSRCICLYFNGIFSFNSDWNHQIPGIRSSMLMRLNDLSCQLLDKKSSKIRKWYSEVVNRKEDRQYNGLKNTSTKHYTEN